MRLIRRLERWSHPRLRFLFGHRLTNLVRAGGSPASTRSPLGVVVLSLGVLLEDFAVVVGGLMVGAIGVSSLF